MVSIILLICGIHITNIFSKLSSKIDLNKHSKFSEIRLIQLKVTIYITFCCTIYQFIFIYLKNFIHPKDYKEGNQVVPNTTLTFWLHFFYLLADLLITLGNYLSFYFFIKHQFTKAKIVIKGEDLKIEEYFDYEKTNEQKINEDMKKFLIDDSVLDKSKDKENSIWDDSFEHLSNYVKTNSEK